MPNESLRRTDVHLPLLPLELVPPHSETDAFGLNDVQGRDVRPGIEVGTSQVRQEVEALSGRRNALALRCLYSFDGFAVGRGRRV